MAPGADPTAGAPVKLLARENRLFRRQNALAKRGLSWSCRRASRMAGRWLERPSRHEAAGPNPKRQDQKLQWERQPPKDRQALSLPTEGPETWGPAGSACPPALVRQTEVCTGVAEWEGEEPRSEEDEMERVATSRCSSSTFFCSSVLMASSSLRFW